MPVPHVDTHDTTTMQLLIRFSYRIGTPWVAVKTQKWRLVWSRSRSCVCMLPHKVEVWRWAHFIVRSFPSLVHSLSLVLLYFFRSCTMVRWYCCKEVLRCCCLFACILCTVGSRLVQYCLNEQLRVILANHDRKPIFFCICTNYLLLCILCVLVGMRVCVLMPTYLQLRTSYLPSAASWRLHSIVRTGCWCQALPQQRGEKSGCLLNWSCLSRRICD